MGSTEAVTAALQIAIKTAKNNGTAEQAKKEALSRFWRVYSPETKAAAERAIDGYFKTTPVAVVPVVLVNTFRSQVVEIFTNPSQVTKPQLVLIGEANGVKLAKTWAKAKMIETLDQASLIAKAA